MKNVAHMVRVMGLVIALAIPLTSVAATPTVALTSSNMNPVAGETITLTATVSGSAGLPTGNVTFKEGALTLPGCNAIVLNVIAKATCQVFAPLAGVHSYTAQYSGDPNYTPLTSGLSSVNAVRFQPTLSMTSDVNPSVVGQSVTYTATIVGGVIPATGTIQFAGAPFLNCSTVPVVFNTATCTTPMVAGVGTNFFNVFYSGDANNFSAASPSYLQEVGKANPTITMGASQNPAALGVMINLVAHVTGVPNFLPFGTVSFMDGATPVPSCSFLSVNNPTGTATCQVFPSPQAGTHTITAAFSGDAFYNAAITAPYALTISKATPVIGVMSSLNPSALGQSVLFLVTLSNNPQFPFAGTVALRNGGVTVPGCGAVPIFNGSASCATSGLPAGANVITASYAGDSNYIANVSSDFVQTVSQLTPALALNSSPNPSENGATVTITAMVSGTGAAPTGTFAFEDDATGAGTTYFAIPGCTAVPVVGGQATCSPSFGQGTHALRATYSGDASYKSGAATTNQAVKFASTITLGATPNPSNPGQAVTFTASIALSGSSEAGGNVVFRDGGTPIAGCTSVALSNASAQCVTSALASGSHSITVTYAGDVKFSSGTSNTVSQVVAGTFVLTVSRSGAGTGSVSSAPAGIACGSTCAASFLTGTMVTLTATPSAGSIFAGWSGACSGIGACQVTLSAAQSVTAIFDLDPLADADGDGIPNGVEPNEGRNPFVKDNNVFANARLFAMQQYRDFLGREGDAAGIQFYVDAITAGTLLRAQVIENFFNSPEFQGVGSPVARLYFATFLRTPDYAGLIFQIDAFRQGTPLTVIANNFTLSPEFITRYGALDNAAFVALLYSNILGRTPSQGEIDFHVARLVGGTTRGEVLVGFSESPEYQGLTAHDVYVTMMYVGMLRRAPEQGGLDFWVAYMDAGNSGLALIMGFLNAPEYHNRFLP